MENVLDSPGSHKQPWNFLSCIWWGQRSEELKCATQTTGHLFRLCPVSDMHDGPSGNPGVFQPWSAKTSVGKTTVFSSLRLRMEMYESKWLWIKTGICHFSRVGTSSHKDTLGTSGSYLLSIGALLGLLLQLINRQLITLWHSYQCYIENYSVTDLWAKGFHAALNVVIR